MFFSQYIGGNISCYDYAESFCLRWIYIFYFGYYVDKFNEETQKFEEWSGTYTTDYIDDLYNSDIKVSEIDDTDEKLLIKNFDISIY